MSVNIDLKDNCYFPVLDKYLIGSKTMSIVSGKYLFDPSSNTFYDLKLKKRSNLLQIVENKEKRGLSIILNTKSSKDFEIKQMLYKLPKISLCGYKIYSIYPDDGNRYCFDLQRVSDNMDFIGNMPVLFLEKDIQFGVYDMLIVSKFCIPNPLMLEEMESQLGLLFGDDMKYAIDLLYSKYTL